MPFDFESIRDLMKCLKCGSSLGIENNQLVCENKDCRQTYPIRDDIPRLLVEDEEEEEESVGKREIVAELVTIPTSAQKSLGN